MRGARRRAVLLILLAGCLRTTPESMDAAVIDSNVGPQGGSIETSGARLDFPADALAAPQHITLEQIDFAAPAGRRAAGPAWRAGPGGLQFQRAVMLTVPLTHGSQTLAMASFSDDGALEVLPASRVGDTAVAFVWHFSIFLPLALDSDAGAEADAGGTDAGPVDAGLADAGTRDAGVEDAGLGDGGQVDAGCRPASPPGVRCDLAQFEQCYFAAECSDSVLRVAGCDNTGCFCREGNVVWRLPLQGNGCDPTNTDHWSCGCGFPPLTLLCSSPWPVPVEPTPDAGYPGTQSFLPGVRCVDATDCGASPFDAGPGICFNGNYGQTCTWACNGSRFQCPCGYTCGPAPYAFCIPP
jgi:hypothetical protein